MAWKTGPHAEAPQGVLCFGGPEPGTVTWFEDDASRKDERSDKRDERDEPR